MKKITYKIIALLVVFFTQNLQAQWTTPTIDAANDGVGNYPNNYTSGTTNWAITWNNTDLFVSINNANQSEPVTIYLDVDPIVPVNGGANANGTLVGLNYDGYTTRPNLPFRADVCIYAHNGYREIFRRDGANGWTSIGGQPNGITGTANDYVSNANGQYSSNDNGNGNGGDDRREFRISWLRLQGAINGGARPTAFNWMGYLSYNNGMYAQVPVENYNGSNVIGNSNGIVRYFTVSNTGNGTSTNPFGQNSYTQPLTSSNAAFGGISVYDFTMNSSGQTITRTAGGGQAWTIAGNLVVANGSLTSGTSTTAISTRNLDIRGGTLTLSGSVGGDLNVSGNFIKTSGTYNNNNRQVNFNGTTAQIYSSNITQTINFLLISNTSVTVTANSSITVPNNLTINAGANCRLDMGNNTLNLTGSSANVINGNLRVGGTGGAITGTTAGNTTFGAGSFYEHNYSTIDGHIPLATWNASSTCLMMGYTSGTQPASGLNQSFGHFTWNCPSQTTSPMLDGALTTVNGNLSILAINSNEIGITTSIPCTLNIGGSLTISDGIFSMATGIENCVINVAGNLTVNNANAFLLLSSISSIAGAGTLNVLGNVIHSDGIIDLATSDFDGILRIGGNYTQSAPAILQLFSFSLSTLSYVEFNGAGLQNVTLNGSVLSNVNFRVNGGGVNLTGTLPLNDNANGGAWGATLRMSQGNIIGSGTVFYDQTGGYSTLVYDASTSAQTTTGVEFPAINSPMNLIIDNTFATNTVTLHANRTIGGTLTLNAGILVLNANNLSVVEPPVGGSSTAYVRTNSTGVLQLALMGGGFSFNFPVGNSTYNPVIISNSGTTDSYSVRVVDGTPPSPFDATKVINRSWIVAEGAAGGSSINMSAYWNSPSEEAVNFAAGVTRRFGLWNGVSWTQNGATVGGSNPFFFSNTASFVNVGTFALGKDDAFLSSATTYTWNGATNGAWTTATNWTPNGVPTAADNVIFNVVGTNPTNFNTTQTINNLSLIGTGSLNLGASGNLTIAGNLTYVNTATASFNCASTLSISSAASQTIPSLNYGNLILTGGPRVLSNTGTIGICGNYTASAGVTTTTGSTVNFNGTAAQSMLTSAANFNNLLISNTTANVTSSVAVTITSNLTINAGVNCRFDMGANTLTITGSAANLINGTLRIGGSSGSIVGMTALNTTFSATGTYEHNYTTVAGIVPAASWNAASNCNIIGYTTNISATGGLSQTFGNFTWNCPSQTAALNLLGGLNGATIAGNFNVMATNSGSLRLTSFASMTLNILGNLNVSGGNFAFTNVITPNTPSITINVSNSINISGGVTHFQTIPPALTGGVTTFNVSTTNFNVTAGSLIIFAASAGLGSTANINISGNFTQSGGTVNNCSVGAANGIISTWNILGNFNQTAGSYTGASSGTNPEIYLNIHADFSQSVGATITAGAAFPRCQIEFKGALNQNVSVSGNTLNNLWWRLNNAAGITMATNITINSVGKFIRTTGAISGVGGILYIAGSQLRYNGTVNMTSTDKEWPVAMTGVSVEIDNAAGINLHASRTATSAGGEVRLTTGSLFLGNNDLFIDYFNNGNYAITSPSATNMFVTNGTGQFLLSTYIRSGSPVGFDLYVFPIGDNTGSLEYSPVELKFYKNTVSRIIGLRVVDAINPNINTPVAATDYLSRYWMVTENGAGGLYRDSITTFYSAADVNGTEANIKLSTYAAGTWTEHGTTVTAGVKIVGFQPSTAAFTQAYLPLNGLEITGRRAPILTNYTWVGSTSNDYNTASNWSPVGVPTAADNITVGVSAPNPCVINSGSFTVTNFNLNVTGNFQLAAGTSITVNGVMSYGGSATGSCACSSTFNIAGSAASDVPPINYGNLNISGGNRTLANAGTIGVCGTYTPGAGVITITSSTVNFNGTTAQTVSASSYNNLTISNARTTNNITLSGLINVAGVFNPSATFTSGNYLVTGNTVNYNGANGQTIVAFNYNNLSSTNNNRVLQNTGNIGIAGAFTPGIGIYTTTGSTVVFNGVANQTVPVFTSLTANRSYHHLTIEGTGLYTPARTWGGAGITNGITGNLTLNGGQFEQTTTLGGVTLYINGNLNLTNANARFSQHSGNLSNNNTYVLGNWIQSAGRFDFNTSVGGTGDGFVYLSGNLTATGGLINCASVGSNTINPTFAFDGTGVQNYSRTGGGNLFVDFVIGANKSLLLLSNFSVTDGDIAVGANATIDAQGFTVTTADGGASADEFRTNAGSLIRTTHASGIVGMAPSGTRNFNTASIYEFYGANQNTGFNTVPVISTAAQVIMNLSGTLTNTSASFTINTALTLTSGIFNMGAANTINLGIGATVAIAASNFIVGTNAGTLNFIGSGTFTGVSNPYNVTINGGVNFGAGINATTIQSGGTLRINAGGFVNTSAPFYHANSTLQYFTGGTYGRNLEWSAAAGRGYPGHVQVSNNTTLNPGAGGNTGLVLNAAGNLTVDGGSNLYMDNGGNNMTVPLIVNGNINLVGNLSGSNSIGGDIELKGNWNNNGVAITNFFPNSRAVTFNGTINQNIGGTNTTVIPFAFLTINNAAGVTLTSYNVEVNNQLNLTSGKVTLGNFNLKLNGLNTPIAGGTSSNYIVTNGSGVLSRNFNNTATLYPVGPNASTYSPVTMQQSGTVDDITVRVNTAPAFVPLVNDNNQMVNLQWTINEGVAGGNNLSSNFQWPLSSEAAGFIRANGVFQGDYSGAAWQVRSSTLSGVNPYLSSSSSNYTGALSNRPFVIGNINGIVGCVSTLSAGDWHDGSIWAGGVPPTTASAACIGHAIQITASNTNALSSVTLNAGGSLAIDATFSLVFGTGGLLTNSSGAANTITGLGSIIYNGAGTIAGGNAITINSAKLNGLTTISTPLTVNGDLTLNSGSSVSATPTYGSNSSLIYNTGGSYGVNLEWTGNSVTAGIGVPNNVGITNTTTLNMPISDRGLSGTLGISNGTLNMGTGDLYVNGDWSRDGTNGFFNPNGKAIFFNRAGTQNIVVMGGGTETFNYLVLDKPSGSLVLDPGTHITVNGSVGNTLQLLNMGVLDLNGNNLNLTNAGGSILASGGVRSIISTFPNGQMNVQASKSVTSNLGGTLKFGSNVKVALSAGMDFGNTLSTIQGTLQIALGGFVTSNPPTYATSSTLRYFSGSNYGRGLEWSATSGPGYPYHVDIDQNGTVTTLDLSNGGSAIRQIAGNLNLNQGGNLSMGAMSNPLIVKGNVNIGGASSGSLTLSTVAGGDIQIAGNLTRNVGGTFTQNGREVTMNGTALQTISNNIPSFSFLNIDNNGASVQINTNTTINTRLRLSNGLYDLNGFTNTMANGSQIRRSAAAATMSAAPAIVGGNVVDMQYDATMTSDVEFIQDLNKIRDLEITLGTLSINENKTINRNLVLSGGDLNLATFTFTDRGNATAPSFAGSITVSGGGTRLIVGSLGSNFDITGLGGNSPLLYTKTVSSIGGTLLSFDSNVLVRIGDGAVDFGFSGGLYPTTINGALQVMLGGSVGQILNPCYYGTNSILRFSNTVDYQVGLNDKTWASGAIGSGNPGIPWNVEVNDIGTDLQLQNTRALRGNLTITNGTFTLTPVYSGTFAIGGNWTRTGAFSAFTHNNKKVVFDKQIVGDQAITVNTGVVAETYYDLDFSPAAGNVIMNVNVNALNAVGLVSGKVNLNGNTFTLGTTGNNGTLTGGTASEYFISGTAASKLVRYTTTASTSYSYPVGDVTNYTPMTVQLYAGTMGANSQVSVNVIPTAHPNIGTSDNYLKRYWQVEPNNFPTPQIGYGVTYVWAPGDEYGLPVPIPANLKPFKHNPQGWIAALGSGASVEMGSGTVTPGTRTITWDGLYSFSDFTGNGNGTPLPISLIDFNVQPVLENVEVTWTTASETNNDYFIIERSKDGVDFEALSVVDGAGNSNTILNYKVMDYKPYEGLSYYRLKQTDFDGKFEYGDIKSVNFVKPSQGQNWSVYPNPSNLKGINLVTGALSSDLLQLSLTDVTGKVVFSKSITANDTRANSFIAFENVSTGIYYLTILDGDQSRTIKVILSAKE
jgi:hypothetical protein